jgi:NADH:ubiquinone oxidoreductase subunit C
MLAPLDQIKSRIEAAVAGSKLEVVPNEALPAQGSLLVNRESMSAVAKFLRDDPEFRFEYASNVTGVDWPDLVTKENVKFKKVVDGAEK